MIMQKVKLYILSFLSVAILLSCETTEKIEDFPLRPSQLVVNCLFTQDSIWEFQVSKSLSVLDNADLPLITDAVISLYKNSELLEEIFRPDEDGWYRYTDHLPEVNQEYSIEVSAPDFENTLLAKEYSVSPTAISNASIIVRDSSFWQHDNGDWMSYGGNVEGSFLISLDDPVATENYYALAVYSIDTAYYNWEDRDNYVLETNSLVISCDDPSIDGEASSSLYVFFTDAIFNGEEYQIKLDFEDWRATRNKIYFIKLSTLQRSAYLYQKSIDQYFDAATDPFSEPVQIFSNIENGYGIFSSYAETLKEVGY
jgi:hypothetical protein